MLSLIPRCLLTSRYYPVNCVLKRYAGHSKWQNIRHTKAAKDLERSKIIQQFVQRIRVAIQDGGSADPSKNVQLKQAVEQARRQNMPAATIENHLKTARENKDGQRSTWVEVRGVRGSCLLISAFTANPKHLRDSIVPILKKHRAELADNTVKQTFENKGIVVARPPAPSKGSTSALDEAVAHAIEVGAEEVEPSERDAEALQFVCEMKDLDIVRTKLITLNYTIESSELSFVPKIFAQLSDPEMELMHKLIGKIEDLPQVVQVYDNIDWNMES